jgi:hypothetical protein
MKIHMTYVPTACAFAVKESPWNLQPRGFAQLVSFRVGFPLQGSETIKPSRCWAADYPPTSHMCILRLRVRGGILSCALRRALRRSV